MAHAASRSRAPLHTHLVLLRIFCFCHLYPGGASLRSTLQLSQGVSVKRWDLMEELVRLTLPTFTQPMHRRSASATCASRRATTPAWHCRAYWPSYARPPSRAGRASDGSGRRANGAPSLMLPGNLAVLPSRPSRARQSLRVLGGWLWQDTQVPEYRQRTVVFGSHVKPVLWA